jgi:hypothetical protein
MPSVKLLPGAGSNRSILTGASAPPPSGSKEIVSALTTVADPRAVVRVTARIAALFIRITSRDVSGPSPLTTVAIDWVPIQPLLTAQNRRQLITSPNAVANGWPAEAASKSPIINGLHN